MPAIARMRAVVLDCADPRALAEFYRALVGGDITYADDHSNLPAGASLPIGATVEFAVRPGRKGDEAHDVTLV